VQYEIRAMALGELLDVGFRLIRDHFAVLVALASVLYVPTSLLQSSFEEMIRHDPQTALLVGGGLGLLSLAFTPLVFASITYALGQAYLGRPARFAASMRAGLRLLLPLVGTWLLAYLALGGAIGAGSFGAFLLWNQGARGLAVVLALLALGLTIYLGLGFMILTQVMVLEGRFGVDGMRRSRELMQGHLVRGIVIVLATIALTMVLVFGAELALGWIPLLGPVGAGVLEGLASAYASAVMVLLYFDIRCRKEAFDLEHLSALVSSAAPDSAPPQLQS
jgi:hypothetical protein